MTTNPRPGRHRAPGRHNPLNELRLLAKESAQPVMKGAATVAAAGGLIATVAGPAGAETVSSAQTNTVEQASATVPSAVGPKTATTQATNALAAIGYAAPRTAPKPQVIEDIVVKEQRAEAAAKAKAEAAAKAKAEAAAKAQAAAKARAAAAARAQEQAQASRSNTRATLTASTYSAKVGSNAPSGPAASSGIRSSYNWATAGQCTWGALAKWYQSEGYYPGGWTGNALVWGSGARNAGYTVSSVPRARSIVVLQPGVHGSSSSAGHVAWVTAVNGNQVTVVEMNALAGAYNYNTRTLTDVSGMQYIYAP